MTIRRRLAVAFVLVAGLLTGALALGSFLLVQQERQSESVSAALRQARANLAVADRAGTRADLLASYAVIGGFSTAGVLHGTAFSSSPFVPGVAQVPAGLVAGRVPAWRRATIGGVPYLVVAARTTGPGGAPIALDFFFDESQLQGDLDQLRNVLAGGWLVAVLVAGLAGSLAARRTLRPVALAGEAARAMAAGALDTRIAARGRDEFARFAAAFNDMAGALSEQIEALEQARVRERRFTADVAHELRTPLTALVGEAELLVAAGDAMGDEGRRLAAMLGADVQRLRRLVGDLLEVSRLDAAAEPLRIERLDVAGLVAGMVRAHDWNGRVVVAGALEIDSDARRLERILTNLIGNAVEHTRGPVRVELERLDGEAVVTVSDRGEGIRDDSLPHLFERFWKADSARSGGGSGLGLAIALEHATALGGRIEVDSQPGHGTRFVLHLPVAESLPDGGPGVAERADTGLHANDPV